MSKKQIALTLTGALVAAVIATVALAAWPGPHRGSAGMFDAVAFRSHGQGRIAERICSEQRDERLDKAIGFVESFTAFTAQQTGAWNDLVDALRAGSARVGDACSTHDWANAPASAPEKLARLEVMVSLGLDLVQQVRPAFDSFYATLDEKQKKALDDLIGRHHRRHG